MTPLYDADNPIKWRELEFEQLLQLLEGRIKFHANKSRYKLPDMDYDDVFQELSLALWNKMDKIPAELEIFDYRLLRYLDKIFFREVINIYRTKTFFNSSIEQREYKDELSRSLPMVDEFDEWFEQPL